MRLKKIAAAAAIALAATGTATLATSAPAQAHPAEYPIAFDLPYSMCMHMGWANIGPWQGFDCIRNQNGSWDLYMY